MATNKPKRPGRPENLKPMKSVEEAREKGRIGGKRSGEVRREKRLLSEEYAKVMAELYDADPKEGMTIGAVVKAVLGRSDSASVAMLKEIREATEGSKLAIDGNLSTTVAFEFVEPPNENPE